MCILKKSKFMPRPPISIYLKQTKHWSIRYHQQSPTKHIRSLFSFLHNTTSTLNFVYCCYTCLFIPLWEFYR